jgi:hypothetical protein
LSKHLRVTDPYRQNTPAIFGTDGVALQSC